MTQHRGQGRIEASRDNVWAALNDAALLKQCILGCESIEKSLDKEMTAKVTLRPCIQRISKPAPIRLRIDIPELDYPKLVTLDGAVRYVAVYLKAA